MSSCWVSGPTRGEQKQGADADDEGAAADEGEAADERIRNEREQEHEAAVGDAEPADGGGLLSVVAGALFFGEVNRLVEAGEELGDVGLVLVSWGQCEGGVAGCVGDIDKNGSVDAGDIALIVLNYGS